MIYYLKQLVVGDRNRRADCKRCAEVGASLVGCIDSQPDSQHSVTAVVLVSTLTEPGCLFVEPFLQ